MIDLVTKSDFDSSEYYYDNIQKTYLRIKDGDALYAIKGCYLQSPCQIRASRVKAISNKQLPHNARVEPTRVATELWEHYIAKCNA